MSLQIKAIELPLLRNSEYIQFSRNYLGIILPFGKTTLKVGTEYDAYDVITAVIEGIFKTNQGSSLTPIIEAIDARRDRAIWGIWGNINSKTFYFDPAVEAAANTLQDYLKTYGTAKDVATSSLPSETATIKSIIADVTTKPNLVAAVTTLALAAWFAELNTANNLLDQKYLERTVELGGTNPNTIKDKRIESYNHYYALRDMLQAQALIDKGATPAFATCINQLNALIDQYNTLINNRAARAEKAAEAMKEEAPKPE